VISRTECLFGESSFWKKGSFPNKVSFLRLLIRVSGCFPERSIISSAVGSGFGVIFRTECLFGEVSFGKRGSFPDKVSFLRLLVRVSGHFPRRNAFLRRFRSGKGVVSRTKYHFFGNWFGFRGDFRNGMPFWGGFVRGKGWFPEQNAFWGEFVRERG